MTLEKRIILVIIVITTISTSLGVLSIIPSVQSPLEYSITIEKLNICVKDKQYNSDNIAEIFDQKSVNLSNCDLSGISLHNVNLQNADLKNTNLSGSDL
ncbi:MAG: pentapeptide repeat-containing protein, partial [Nitrosopumilus sp.]|nr:pentapeptide repeat-containing protein [Nitrosopumilus sp.]